MSQRRRGEGGGGGGGISPVTYRAQLKAGGESGAPADVYDENSQTAGLFHIIASPVFWH